MVQKITNSKMVMSEESKHKDNLTVFIDNLPQEGNKHKFDYEKMEFTTAFYHALINNQDLTLDSVTEPKLTEYYSTIAKNQKSLTKELGYKLLTNFLEYERESLNDEWAYLIGKTKYFFSYNQNLLEHLLEVSTLSANFAFQLGLDVLKAKRAAFFHDIGKVTGQYSDHVTDGVNLANQFELEEYIKETIEAHHNYEHSVDNPYLIITRAMDKLSAGRLGARPLQLEKTQERNEKINSLLSSMSEISKLEFLAGGHIIKVYLKPESFQWNSLEELKKKISSLLKGAELKYQYNYQFILRLEYSDSFLLNDY
ncbi:HDIG domain-containing metalloprotein [Mycoplasma wenyonii]|nr:HDIG domain-containing metalloprotein [Mycoplasma wenyonii]